MINKNKLIEEIVKFINSKLGDLSSGDALFNILARPYIEKVINTNISKLDKFLSLITDENGLVDAEGLLKDIIDRLVTSQISNINGLTIGEGSIKMNIPFTNKTIVLDKEDFDELKANIEKYGNVR